MNALTAPLLHVQRSDALWLVPAAPLLGALARVAIVDPDDPPEPANKRLVAAMAPSAVALLLVSAQLFALGSLEPESRLLFAPGFVAMRVGTFEVGFGLAVDPTAALVAFVVAALGVAAQGVKGDKRSALAIDLAVTGALTAVLADGFFGLLVGGVVASAALARVAYGDRPMRAFFASRIADVALCLGAVLAFWALGGSWGIALGNEPTYTRHNPAPANIAQIDPLDSDEPDVASSLHPVLIGSAPPPAPSALPKGAMPDLSARGSITLATAPGSRLFLKGASEAAGDSPVVRHEVYAGRIDVEVERPNGKRVRFRALEVPNGREIAIVPVGPTWSFRELRDQLGIEDASHQKFVRNLLDPAFAGHRKVGAWSAAHLLAALIGLAGLAWIGSVAFAEDVLVASLGGLVGVYLLARLEMLVVLSPGVSGALAAAAGLLSIACAVGAALMVDARRVLAHLLGVFLSIAALAVFIGSPSIGVWHAVAAVVVCGLAQVLLERLGAVDLRRVSDAASSAPRATRALRVLAFALAGAPVPFLGAAFGAFAIVGRAFGAELPRAKVGGALAALAVVGVAWATWRVWFLVCAGPPRKRPIEDLGAPWANGLFGAALVIAALAPLLGVSRLFLGVAFGGEHGAIESFLDAGVAPAAVLGLDRAVRLESGRAIDLLVIFALLAATSAAWFFARRRLGEDDRPKPVAREESKTIGAALLSFVAAFARLDDWIFAKPIALLTGWLDEKRKGAP